MRKVPPHSQEKGLKVDSKYPVIAWWSGGIASAVTCKICIEWFGLENVLLVFIDTHNEHPSTAVFKEQCEKWYGKEIISIHNHRYEKIQDVWYEHLSLNVAKGAKCSAELKSKVRQDFIKRQPYSFQAFGFDVSELNRARDMKQKNYYLRPIFPLIATMTTKEDCIKQIEAANSLFLNIQVPDTYKMGLRNNNCFQTGCVQGGIGYWQWMQINFPEKFEAMAKIEHDLTEQKGEPVTMLKDQSEGGGLVFLKPNPAYPKMKDISMMKGRPIEPLMECNGFCSKQ